MSKVREFLEKVVTSDPATSRPVVRLAVVPRNPTEVKPLLQINYFYKTHPCLLSHITIMFQVAPSITHRLEGRPGEYQGQEQGHQQGRGKEGDQSVMALRSRCVIVTVFVIFTVFVVAIGRYWLCLNIQFYSTSSRFSTVQ